MSAYKGARLPRYAARRQSRARIASVRPALAIGPFRDLLAAGPLAAIDAEC